MTNENDDLISVRLPGSLTNRLERQARMDGMSRSYLIRRALKREVERLERSRR